MVRIKDEDLRRGAEEGMDEFLQVFIDAYEEVIGGDLTAETMGLLSGHQLSLLAYYYFRREVMEGGFVQLIYNGYGGFIFENPFAKAMRQFGAHRFSKLIYRGREIYMEHKEDLTRERSDEEFMATYEQYAEFDRLEEIFLDEEEHITATLAAYVDEHIEEFCDEIIN
ncbi:MAG: DMP19 family protein [Bacteroidaceae bacterium]|nr:DMP19 family protein [Bacteroidaceae bacterium]